MDAGKVYIGYDPREDLAYKVAVQSLRKTASIPLSVTPLMLPRVTQRGLVMRPYRIYRNSIWDVISEAPASTEFAASRFLVPIIAQTGWALFTDCDVVFLGDVKEIFDLADPQYAVMVVKHDHVPTETHKMGGAVQTTYGRKNWSSVMLFNCDHPSNDRLTLDKVNNQPGRELHQFAWLKDEEIGSLPPEWNWLVNVEVPPPVPKLAHFTLGGPWFEQWSPQPHDDLWLHAAADCGA